MRNYLNKLEININNKWTILNLIIKKFIKISKKSKESKPIKPEREKIEEKMVKQMNNKIQIIKLIHKIKMN